MRLIDPTWMDISIGYQLVRNLQSSLKNEFGRAIDIGYKRKYHRELNEWQKKRRTFIALVALVPLPFIALCILTFYFREVACVLAWWILTCLLAILAMGVAGGRYIIQMVSGKPVSQRAKVAGNLTDHWWDSLSPKMLVTKDKEDRREAAFLTSLFPHLNDEWFAIHNLFLSPKSPQYSDILLVGPSGLWIFDIVDWKGIIAKEKGHWIEIQKNHQQVVFIKQPDKTWIHQKEVILDALRVRLPYLHWMLTLINGGIVFTNPKIQLDKTLIVGNIAPYGIAAVWREILINSVPDEKMTQEVRLEILDMLCTLRRPAEAIAGEYRSSGDEANRLYKEVAIKLRDHVSKLVK
jgi:hypothetical protein